jgi:hypothetical protein
MQDPVQGARQRLLDAVRSGNWERVPAEVDAYGAAVRSDERKRAIDQAVEALIAIFDQTRPSGAGDGELRDRCLSAIDRLH